MQCNACATELLHRAKFCSECGAAQPPPSERVSEYPSGRDLERRSLTVMFCDLVGSTRLAHRLDPEELRDIISRYQAHCVEAVVRHQGYIAQFLGDGVLVYFGYPTAHEDATLRAARASLEIVENLPKLNRLILRHYKLRVAIRVGIHRGLVVIGELGAGSKREILAVGETTNIAAKLQASAEPNTIVVSAEVQRLIRKEITSEECGQRAMAGAKDPGLTYRVLGRSNDLDDSSRLAQPLVARDSERKEIERLLQRSLDDTGEAVLLVGVPGIGKSRLLGWLHEHVLESDRAWLQCRCNAYTSHTPLAPLVTLQQECFGFLRSDSARDKLRKLGAALDEVGLWSPLNESLLCTLHALEPHEPAGLAELSPELQRRRTLELCVSWFLALAQATGLVLVIDDLHWIDPTTDELFALLLEKIGDRKVLLVGASRPEFESPWWSGPRVHRLELSRLAVSEVRQIVTRLGSQLPPELIDRIVARSDGVPLFAEEMSLAALESDDPTAEQVTPPSIEDLLQSRLDRLGAAKTVAQVCAAIGSDAAQSLIERVAGESSLTVSPKLETLVRSQLMTRSITDDGTCYSFRHALIRDIAYDGLLKSQRRHYHGRIAEALNEQADLVQRQPEIVAYHFARSEDPGRSVDYWLKAGQLRVQRSSMREAIQHLSTGLGCLQSLPFEPQRMAQELGFQTLLGISSMAAFGYANDVVRGYHARAAELCEVLRAPSETFPVSFGLWLFSLVRADREATHDFARRLLEAANVTQNQGFLMQAQLALTLTKYWSGEFEEALGHAGRVIDLYDEGAHSHHALSFGDDPRVYGHVYRGMAQYFLGLPDSARQSLAVARRYAASQPPFTRVGAAAFETQLINLTGETEHLEEAAKSTLAESTEQGFPLFVAVGAIHAGWAGVLRGDAALGLSRIQSGIDGFVSTGAKLNLPYFEAHMARAQGASGDVESALEVIDRALARTETSLDTYYVPELLRFKAELELRAGRGEEAALLSLHEALSLARTQKSKAHELRALCTIALEMPRSKEASSTKQELQRLVASYTEGLDSPDLRVAQRLL